MNDLNIPNPMSRAEYMRLYSEYNGNDEAQHRIHRAYYAQFVNELARSVARDLLPKLLASKDRYFNDTTTLPMFDRYAPLMKQHIARVDKKLNSRRVGTWSLSDNICVLKEACRQTVEAYHAANARKP